MIIDIDSSDSVKKTVTQVSENWFDAKKTFFGLKGLSKTEDPNFWGNEKYFWEVFSEFLSQTTEVFLKRFHETCIANNVKVMGYHCTRYKDEESFMKKGILPVTHIIDKNIVDTNNIECTANDTLNYRLEKDPGPYFFLSYKRAKKANNFYLTNGHEISLLYRKINTHRGISTEELIPIVFHCKIPYSILPEDSAYPYFFLMAYFNFLDPTDDSESFCDEFSITLKGETLNPKYIVRSEKLKKAIGPEGPGSHLNY
jgi:hypothetical protein